MKKVAQAMGLTLLLSTPAQAMRAFVVPQQDQKGAFAAAQSVMQQTEGLPVIPGKPIATGTHRPWTADEKAGFKLLKKAARLAHTKFTMPPRPCVMPSIFLRDEPGDGNPDLMITVDPKRCQAIPGGLIAIPTGDDTLPIIPAPGTATPPPALQSSSITTSSFFRSYTERNFDACSVPPGIGACGLLPPNRVAIQTFEFIDPEPTPIVVTRAVAYGVWNWNKGGVQNTQIPCSPSDPNQRDWEQCINRCPHCNATCDNTYLNQCLGRQQGCLAPPVGNFCPDECVQDDWVDWEECLHNCNSCHQGCGPPPVCLTTKPTPGYFACFEPVSYTSGRVGFDFPYPINLFANGVGWFPRFPTPEEVNLQVPRTVWWQNYQLDPPQDCPVSSGSKGYLTPPAHSVVWVVGSFQWVNNLDFVLLKLFGHTENLDPFWKAFVEESLPRFQTEMPHWMMAGFDTDSSGARGFTGWGGNIGAAPFFKQLQFHKVPIVFSYL